MINTQTPAGTELLSIVTAPFEGGAPAGEDLRLDIDPRAIYSALRDARSEVRALERRAENDPASGLADQSGWKTVERLSIEALTSRSKDVEIACWLAESLTRRRGLAGLAEGARILCALISGFWTDGLFPHGDDDPSGRLASITGLSGESRDGSLLQPLRRIVLFEMHDGTPVSLWQYERSRETESLNGDAKARQGIADLVPFADIEIAARGHGRAMLLDTALDAIRAADAWRRLEAVAATVVEEPATPSIGRVLDLLASFVKIAERYLPASELHPAIDMAEPDVSEPVGEVEESVGVKVVPILSRDAMLDEIIRIAGAFRANEPNSPLSYTLEEAVRRARLSWLELLREVLPDLQPRTSVLSGLGIRPPAE